MGCDRFGNSAEAVSLLARLFNRIFADVLPRLITWKEPVLGSFQTPPVTQGYQHLRREHHVTIFLSLALLDSQDHPLAVNDRRCETDCFGNAESGRIAGGQDHAMLGTG